jgi:hypothetical protein
MIVKELIQKLRKMPATSRIQIVLFDDESGERWGDAEIIDVDPCECCSTIVIAGVIIPDEEPEPDEETETTPITGQTLLNRLKTNA